MKNMRFLQLFVLAVTLVAFAPMFILTGCTHLYSHQTQKDGTTTEMRATTFFDSKSELSKFSAFQSDKSQKLGIGSLNSEANGSNVVSVFEAIARGAAAGASRAVVPIP